MIQEGLMVTIVGMGTVFMFLTLLVLAMVIMARVMVFVNKFMPEEVEQKVVVRRETNDDDVAVAIAVAKLKMI